MNHSVLEIVRSVITEAGRPLNVRSIINLALREARFPGAIPSVDELKAELQEAAAKGLVVEVRKGVFSTENGSAAVKSSEKVSEKASEKMEATEKPIEQVAEKPAKSERSERRARRERDRDVNRENKEKNGSEKIENKERKARVQDTCADLPDHFDPEAPAQDAGEARSLRRRIWNKICADAADVVQPGSGEKMIEEAEETKAEVSEKMTEKSEHRSVADRLRQRRGMKTEAPKAETPKAEAAKSEAPTPQKTKKLNTANRLRALHNVARTGTPLALQDLIRAQQEAKAALATEPQAEDLEWAGKLLARLRAHYEKSPVKVVVPQVESVKAENSKVEAPKVQAKSEAAAAQKSERAEKFEKKQNREERREVAQASKAVESQKVEETKKPRSSAESLCAAAKSVLRHAGKALTFNELNEAVNERISSKGLLPALMAENTRSTSKGIRAPFFLHCDGKIGLTEWDLSRRALQIESTIARLLNEQREVLELDLLERVSKLSKVGFEQVVSILLERLGYDTLEMVARRVNMTVLLSKLRGTSVAIFALQGRDVISGEQAQACQEELKELGAEKGIIVANAPFADTAYDVEECPAEGLRPMRLMDGETFAHLLFEHGIGRTTLQPKLYHLDGAFFESLD